MPLPAHFGAVVVGYCEDPQKKHTWPETRVLAYRSCRSVRKCDLGARWRKQKKKEKKKRNSEMWQITYLPRLPTLCYSHKVVMWGRVPDAVNRKQTAPRFCQHPIRLAFTSQAFTSGATWAHIR